MDYKVCYYRKLSEKYLEDVTNKTVLNQMRTGTL